MELRAELSVLPASISIKKMILLFAARRSSKESDAPTLSANVRPGPQAIRQTSACSREAVWAEDLLCGSRKTGKRIEIVVVAKGDREEV